MNHQFKLTHIAFICCFAWAVYAQTPNQQPPAVKKADEQSPDVVRVNVNLVQVDATVTDGHGRQVTDLTPEDFEVLDEGRPQKVTHFSYVTQNQIQAVSKTAEPAPLVIAAPNGKTKTLTVAAPLPPVPLQPEQVRRAIALVVDDLGLSHESSVRVRQSLNRFVDQQMLPGDLVAIIRTGAGMGALQQFTNDKRLLHAAIERIRYNLASRSEISTFAPVGAEGIAVQTNDDSLALRTGGGQQVTKDNRTVASQMTMPGQELNQFREELFSVGTLGALNFVVRGMKDLPGRKSVVLFSDGFKLYTEDAGNRRILDNLQRLTDLANRASVVFYTIDPRGLQFFGITAADNLNSPLATINPVKEKPVDLNNLSVDELNRLGTDEQAAAYAKRSELKPVNEFSKHVNNIEAAITDRRSDFFQSEDGLSYLASQTGGFLVKNNNDINGAIRRVLDDQTGFYVLGYRPTEVGANAAARFHQVTVRVKRPGLHVRTRKGYIDFNEAETRQPVRRTASEQLFAALTSPFKSGDIALRMAALFGYDQTRGPFMQSLVHINTPDLAFETKPDGTREAVLDVMAVTFGDNGKVIDQDDRAYKIQFSPRSFERAMREGLAYIVTLPIKKPGAYQLRIAVRDHKSEKVGSVNEFIDVPDVKKGRLTISGVTLRGTDPAAANGVGSNSGSDANDPRTGPAGRRLRAGMVLDYGYFIYNAQVDKAAHLPNLSTQIRLFRDGQMIFAGKLVHYQTPAQPDYKQLIAGGSFKLANDLSPGEYVLQVIVVDHLARNGQQVTSQWIDFGIE
jgi:VWFA-related protein